MFNLSNQNRQERQQQDMPENVKKIDNYYYKVSDLVGQGNFSQVYRGVDQITGKYVAIKVVKKSSITSKVAEQLLRNQTSILKKLDHDNVIKCYQAFQSTNNCYIVTDFYEGGDLEKLIQRHKYFNQKDISRTVYGIYKGLVYLNQNNIVHRDFKPANIFMTSAGIPKIADFGFAVKCNQTFKDISIGSPIYMSPEGLLKRQYGPKTDVWSFGIILYQMTHGQTPLTRCRKQSQLKQKVLQPPIFRDGLSSQFKRLIQLCLIIDPKQRIQVKQIANTPYMKKIINQIQGKMDLTSTMHTNNGTLTSNSSSNQIMQLICQVKTYQDGLALLHYCRLIHKTSKDFTSPIFSQWLLTLCRSLQHIKIHHGDKQSNQKLLSTIHNYNIQYSNEHDESNIICSYRDVVIECQKFLGKMPNSVNSSSCMKIKYNNLAMLLTETEMLQKYTEANKLASFSKFSQIQKYLESLKHGKDGANGNAGLGNINLTLNMNSINLNQNSMGQTHSNRFVFNK